MRARFEIVRGDADQNGKEWHGRYIVNGHIVWHTPRLSRKVGVQRAIRSVLSITYGWIEDDAVVCLSSRDSWNKVNRPVAEVREVDERTGEPS